MTEQAHKELLADVLSRYEQVAEPAAARDQRGRRAPSARLRRGGRPAARRVVRRHPVPHRHGQKCDDNRQEFILLSDTLGVSTLVEFVTHGGTEGSTENTVLGPFYVPGSPRASPW